MTSAQSKKQYDLAERTFQFAVDARALVKRLPYAIVNNEDGKQLVRASGSVGANYIEASEAVSKKDFGHRIKICRKEAKESVYWLKLLSTNNATIQQECERLIAEAIELQKIFGSIVTKHEL